MKGRRGPMTALSLRCVHCSGVPSLTPVVRDTASRGRVCGRCLYLLQGEQRTLALYRASELMGWVPILVDLPELLRVRRLAIEGKRGPG